MKTYLLYNHTRNIFAGNEFNGGIKKWFHNPRFEGSQSGNWGAVLSVTNYDKVKNMIPKTLIPIKTSLLNNF